MGPTWVLSTPEGRHVCPINLAIRVVLIAYHSSFSFSMWLLSAVVDDTFSCHPINMLKRTHGLYHKDILNSKSKSHNSSSCCYINNGEQMRSYFCTYHDNSTVMNCANLWPDWVVQNRLKWRDILQDFNYDYELFVQWTHPALLAS